MIQNITGEGILISQKFDITLEKYTTTEKDKKKKISKIPSDCEMMTASEFQQTLITENEEMKKVRRDTQTIFGSKQQISVLDFKVITVLGRGYQGKVMLVQKNDNKQLYAMKSYKKEIIINNDQFDNIKNEKDILAINHHPFLVKLEFCFQTFEKLYFVMTFVKGGELFQHLRRVQQFDENRAKFYCACMVLALEHLHQRDIIYRDLKPENILLDEQGYAILTDFGLSKKLSCLQTQTLCGTPEYLSPEQVTGQSYGKETDWWSLGVLVYEIMTGQVPF